MAEPESAPSPQARPFRRRLALLVIVVGIAGLVVWWSRSRPADVEVIYDFGRQASRVRRVALTFERDGKEREEHERVHGCFFGSPAALAALKTTR